MQLIVVEPLHDLIAAARGRLGVSILMLAAGGDDARELRVRGRCGDVT